MQVYRYLGLLVAAGVVIAAAAASTFAQSSAAGSIGERISSFDSDVQIGRDNVARVTETITYDFGTASHHGIVRYVPIRTTDQEGNRYYYTFELTGVTDEAGRKLQTKRQDNSTNAVVRVGDPQATVTGSHLYRITYTLHPLIRHGNSDDLFGFNVTGNGWTVPIDRVTAKVHFTEGMTVLRSACYTGPAGSQGRDCLAAIQPGGYDVSTQRPLAAAEGLSIFSDLTAGSVSTYLEPNHRPPIHWGRYLGLILGALGGAVALAWSALTGIGYRMARRRQTIVPLYEPPDKLTPAELGYLHDNRGNLTEVTATLIDLAVRGYLKIEQTQAKGILRKAKYRLTRLKVSTTGLSDVEAPLFAAVFSTGEAVDLDKLDRTKTAAAVSTFTDAVKAGLDAKGYYARPKSRWPKWFGVFLIPLVVIVSLVVALASHASAALVIWGTVAAAVGWVFFFAVLRKERSTPKGLSEWAAVEGFRTFLSMTEKDRLKFTDAPERTPKLFSALLPFATALAVEQAWAKQFAGIDVAKATGWYGGGVLNSSAISSDLGSGFAGSVSSSFTSPSSGGSGGGFSGGGGGGGGGGSW
jgi:uncharacterized membrane protein YgcG